jgi:hypothetical protein
VAAVLHPREGGKALDPDRLPGCISASGTTTDLLSEAFEEKRVPNLVPKRAHLSPTEDNSEENNVPE